MITKSQLTYKDHEGVTRTVKGVSVVEDEIGRHWLWSEKLQINLAYLIKGRENALSAAIASLLHHVELQSELQSERIKSLQRIADLASAFVDQVKPDESEQ